jgi:hypothetical protein
MRERGGRARLAQEAFADHGVVGEMLRQRLERHEAIQAEIARQHHDAHPAAAELALHRVLPFEGRREARKLGGWRWAHPWKLGPHAAAGEQRAQRTARVRRSERGRRLFAAPPFT